jgi:hypothetical protein
LKTSSFLIQFSPPNRETFLNIGLDKSANWRTLDHRKFNGNRVGIPQKENTHLPTYKNIIMPISKKIEIIQPMNSLSSA